MRRGRRCQIRRRNDQRLLVAQRVGQQAEWSDLAGRVHPDFLVAHRQHGDDVIELRGRGNVGIELAAGVDQDGIGVEAFGLEQRRQQRVLVFAVAVLIVKDVGGSVRLIAADSERQADVAEILRDEIVEGFGFVEVGIQSLGQFLRFGANFRRRRAAIALEAGVPAADLLPGFEGGQLNVGAVVFGVMFLLLLVLVFVVVFALEMGAASSDRRGGHFLR